MMFLRQPSSNGNSDRQRAARSQRFKLKLCETADSLIHLVT